MPETTVRYSDLVAAKLRKSEVLKDDIVFSVSYEGNATAGAVKIPIRDTEAAAVDYNSASGAAPTAAATAYKTLVINRDKAVNEIIDGFDAATVPDDLIADRLDSAGYSLAFAVDNDGADVLIAEGTADGVGSMDSGDVYEMIIDTRTKLSKANVPNDGRRYLLVTPDFYARLLKDPNFIAASALGDEIRQTGAVGRIAGFNVFEWNYSSDSLCYIAGHPGFAVRAREFAVPVKVVDLDGDANYIGATAVKGRMVYAHTVLKPEAVRCVYGLKPLNVYITASGALSIINPDPDGEYKYRINPDKNVVYGDVPGNFASVDNGEDVLGEDGAIIEVIQVVDDKVVAVGYGTK
jgi:hypothetical protein